MTESTIQACLHKHLLFSSLSDEALVRLGQYCRTVRLKNDESLFHQGGDAHSFYIVLSGNIKLFRVSPDGQTKVIEVIATG